MGFHNRLKELRERAGMTQGQLAEASGVTKGTIANFEQKRRETPSFEMVVKLARALGVPIESFAVETVDDNKTKPGRPSKK